MAEVDFSGLPDKTMPPIDAGAIDFDGLPDKPSFTAARAKRFLTRPIDPAQMQDTAIYEPGLNAEGVKVAPPVTANVTPVTRPPQEQPDPAADYDEFGQYIGPGDGRTGIGKAAALGAKAGVKQLAESVGTATEYLGHRVGSKTLQETGKETKEYWKPDKVPDDLAGSVIDKPSLLADPSWWVYNVAQTGVSMVPGMVAGVGVGSQAAKYITILGTKYLWTPKLAERLVTLAGATAGGVVGGAQEGAGTYNEVLERGGTEEQAARAMEAMTTASGFLNALSFGQILKPGKWSSMKRFLKTGSTEAFTEYLEEPAEIAIKSAILPSDKFSRADALEQLKQGANVIGPAFVTGGAAGSVGGGVRQQQPAPQGEPAAAPAPESPVKTIVREVLQEKAEAAAQAAMAQQQATPAVSMPNLPPIRDLLDDQGTPAAAPSPVQGQGAPKPDAFADYIEGQKRQAEKDRKAEENRKYHEERSDAFYTKGMSDEQLQEVASEKDFTPLRMENKYGEWVDVGGVTPEIAQRELDRRKTKETEAITLEDAPDQPTPDFWKTEDGKALRAEQQRIEDTKKHLQDTGYKITEKKIRSEKGEADLYKRGYRPYKLRDGALVVDASGIWAKPPGQPEAKEASTLAPPMAEEVTQGPPKKAVAAKELWEMTRAEWDAMMKEAPATEAYEYFHPDEMRRNTIKQALSEGKSIPPEVLKDYPDLKPPKETIAPAPIVGQEPAKELKQDYQIIPVTKAGENIESEVLLISKMIEKGIKEGKSANDIQVSLQQMGFDYQNKTGQPIVDGLRRFIEDRISGKVNKTFEQIHNEAQVVGKPEAKKLTYEEFAKQYQEAFDKGNQYSPKEAGFNVYTDKMARLAEEYPEFLERLESEQEAKAGAKAAPASKPKTEEDLRKLTYDTITPTEVTEGIGKNKGFTYKRADYIATNRDGKEYKYHVQIRSDGQSLVTVKGPTKAQLDKETLERWDKRPEYTRNIVDREWPGINQYQKNVMAGVLIGDPVDSTAAVVLTGGNVYRRIFEMFPALEGKDVKDIAAKLKEWADGQKPSAPKETKPTPAPKEDSQSYKVGDRVVIDGKHGAISRADKFVMRPIFGAGGESITYSYSVKYDSGRESAVIESQLQREKEKPTGEVVPDILVDIYAGGKAAYHDPGSVVDSIQRAKKRAADLREASGRARKPSVKVEKNKQADAEASHSWKLQKAFDEWAAKHPAEAEKYRPIKKTAPGAPATATTGTPIGKNAEGMDIYEDEKGVRKVVEPGGRVTQEPVAMIPTRGGVVTRPSMPRDPQYEVAAPKPAEEAIIQEAKDAGHTDEEIKSALNEGKEAGRTEGANKTTEQIQAKVEEVAKELGVGFAPEIMVDKKWIRNGLVFATEKEASEWGVDRMQRWMMAEDSRSVPVAQAPGWTWKDGELAEIKAAPAKTDPLIAPFGSENKIFTEDKANKAREILKKKLSGLNMGVPLDPEIIQAGIDLAGYYIEGGSRSFTAYSTKMIGDLGDVIRPYLKSFYMAVRNYPGFDKTGMDNEAALDEIDEAIVTPEDKRAILEKVEKGDRVRYKKDYQKGIAIGDASENKGGYVVVRSGGGLTIEVFPADIISVEREGKPLDISEKESKLESKGGDQDERPADGSTGQRPLEEGESKGLQADGKGRGSRGGKRGGSKDDTRRDERSDADQEDGTGSLAGKPAPIHLQDEGTDSGELQPVASTPASEPRTLELAGVNPGNYRITPADDIGSGTRGQKIDRNLAAIRLIKQLEKEKRYPTKEEQSTLAKYVGWGGLKSALDKNSQKPQDIRAREELESLLSREELLSMFLSITDAHYTSPEIISSIYDVIRHLGFNGGNVLEPTYGAGNFLGLMPEDMSASSKWYGSELDTITAKIGQYLYPDSQLIASGFQEAEFPFGKFDLAIGNPPFGDTRIADTKKSRAAINRFKIHNYVISKEAMHLRPGGILANVVTTRFLDTADAEARDFLAKNYRFLGAIRLPNDAFAKNAGTTVTTDIIFMQRLMPDEKPDMKADWLTTGATMENAAGEIITLNKYFAQRPYMMLGEPSMKGTMYGGAWKEGGKGEFTLNKREGQDTGALVTDLLSTHMADLKDIVNQRAGDKADAAAISLKVNREDVGIGGFYQDGNDVYIRRDNDEYENPVYEKLSPDTLWSSSLTPDGRGGYSRIVIKDKKKTTVYYKNAAAVPDTLKLGKTKLERIKGMLTLREKTYQLINAERFDADNIEWLRENLNRVYDAFVKQHGYVSDPVNYGLMSDDIKIEFGLEGSYTKEITPTHAKTLGIKPMPSKAEKASILKERLFFPTKEITTADNITDAYGISLSERGRLDIPYIAGLLKKTQDKVIEELDENDLAYQDPETNEWIQEDEYLSGNVKAKHKIAVEKGLEKNAEALKKVFPPDKPAENIYVGIGATWLPASVYESFGEFIGISRPDVMISHDTGKVFMSGESNQNEVNVTWQNDDYAIAEIFNAAAGHKTLIAYDGRGDDRTVNKDRTKGLASIVKSLKSTFDDWLMADDARAAVIVKEYNDTQNTHAKRRYDGKHLRTVGASPAVALRNTQSNAAWRIIQSKAVLLDHLVGAGKTFTIITGVMERARLGLTKKAMIVVPNHLVGQWAMDWLKLYPGARILAATKKDFAKANRRRLFSRIATGSYDAVIVGHSSFGFVPIEKQSIMNLVMEEIAHLERAEQDAIEAGEKRIAKGLAKRIQSKRERIRELMNKPRDNVAHFEQMGIDHLVVDESHEFKNLEYSSSMQNIAGMGNPSGSKRAFDLYSKIRWLTAQKGHGITFATGTPISNSLVEMYALMRYMNRQGLVDRKLEAFDAWASAYASTENKIEYTASQRLKDRVVMSTFRNVKELVQLFEEFADSVTMTDLKNSYAEQIRELNKRTGSNEREEFPVPNIKDGGRQLDLGDADDSQREYVDYLVARAKRLEDLGRENDPKIDNHLWLMNDARKMALDIRLVDPRAKAGKNNKVQRTAKNVKRIYDKWKKDKGTQLVFCDLSTPAKTAQSEANKFIQSAAKLARVDKDAGFQSLLNLAKSFHAKWGLLRNLIEGEIEAISEAREGEMDAHMRRREQLETFLNEKASDSDLAFLTTADTGFSVYDDLKATLIKSGIPASEIKFIHEANTDKQKQEIFDLVNAGTYRVLIGSTPKMGAGMNVQERLVALHHMDAPWRPSDVEQREGRIIRQGNALFLRDPDGFMIEIHAYSTKNTFDAVMWQILARKQDMLDDFRSGKDVIEDKSDDTSSYADFMAETTNNPVFKEKFRLENEIEEMRANERRIRTRRYSAEHSLKMNENRRTTMQDVIARFKKVLESLKNAEDKFTYQGKEYVNDIQEAEDKERARLKEINDKAAAEHTPVHDKILAQVEAKYPAAERDWRAERHEKKAAQAAENAREAEAYYKELLEKAGIPSDPKHIAFDRNRIARQDPQGATAAAIAIRNEANALRKGGGDLHIDLGGVPVKITVTAEQRNAEGGVNSYSKVGHFVDGVQLYEGVSTAEISFLDIHGILTPQKIRSLSEYRISNATNTIEDSHKEDAKSQQTLDKLQFKDALRLKEKQARYEQVVQEVNDLEAQVEAEREGSENKYITADTDRFGDYDPSGRDREAAAPQEGRQVAAAPKAKAVGKEAEKYYKAVNDDFVEVTGASPVKNDYGLNLFVFEEKDGKFNVTERSTGLMAARGDTQRKAIKAAMDLIGAEGMLDRVKGQIDAKVKSGKTSPWYKATQAAAEAEDTTLPAGLDITRLPSVLKGLYKNFRLSELWEAYKRPPEITESKLIIGKYTGAIQMMDQKLVEWAWKINKEIPKDRQVAITNYMQAAGDMAVLQQRADTALPEHRQGYEDALTLTPEEKQWADAFRARFDEIWQDANDAGIIEDYVENYVRGEWVRPDRAGRKILAMNNAGEFRINPSEAKRKIFQSYFDGEQAGFTPKDKRIGYQVIAAERSIRQAIEARKAIKALMRSTEADGRPTVSVGGAGSYVKDADGTESKAFLVKPNQRGKDTGDYKFLDHPSMRRWKWLGSDTEGRPILMEGNVWIHPAAFSRINALLGKSKIRAFTVSEKIPVIGGTQPFSAALQAGAFVKGSILIGPFHQFHVGEHAVFHKVNPFNPAEIDFDKRPLLKEGVEHGLMLFNHNALYEFGEGLATGGLFHRLPIVGDQLLRYQEWLFQDYIPKLKAAMFEHAVERAEKYYEKELASGKFTRDQLLDNAAKQANAAFGEMNYKYLGRNPTYQDFLRLSLLAPDFLEARLKFAGQALRPYGKEQSMALLRGALIMGGLAVALSLLLGDDDSPWDIKKPFTVVIGGREYTPRSVQADIVHLISSPRSFWYHRLNPLWGRPLVELSTGRDFYGRQPENFVEAAKNILKSWTPIPAQGLVKDNMGDTVLTATINAMMQSIGVTNYLHMSDFQRYAMTEGKRITYRPTATSKLKADLQRKVQRKDPNAMKDIRAARLAGKITDADMTDIIEKGVTDPVQRAAKSMELDDLKKGLKHASAKEMKTIVPIYMKKLENKYNEGGMSGNALKDYVDSLKEAKRGAI